MNTANLARTAWLLLPPLAGLFAANPAPPMRTVHSQPSWILATPQVEVALTRRGGHLAPVTFLR
ncbi:MAG: hypothetical protein ACKOET_03300, partial [Verrucomicrobiota bacterium]